MSGTLKPREFAIVDVEATDLHGREPVIFDVWLVPREELAAFQFGSQYPNAALRLVGDRSPAADTAWAAGSICEYAEFDWIVPGEVWTEDLYREAARRWAAAVTGDPAISLRFMRCSTLDMTTEEWAVAASEWPGPA